MPHPRVIRFTIGTVIALVAMLWPVSTPEGTWWRLWWDWAHAPVFAYLAWEGAPLAGLRAGNLRRPSTRLLTALLALAVAVELLQMLSGRQSDLKDVARSMAGAGTGVCIALAPLLRGWRLAGTVLLSLLLLAATFTEIFRRVLVLREMAAVFPVLDAFRHAHPLPVWSLEHGGIPQPLQHRRSDHGWSLEVPVVKEVYSSLHYDAQGRDWTPFHSLLLRYRLEDAATLHLGLRFDGGRQNHERRYRETHLHSGAHLLVIPLPSESDAGSLLSEMRTLTLFSAGGTQARLFIEELRLE